MIYSFKKKTPDQDASAIPDTPAAKLWYVLTEHFFQLLWANLLCVLFSLPVVTIPSSLCGLYAVLQQYIHEGYGDVFPTFWKEFRTNFWNKLLVTFPLYLLPVAGWFLGKLFAPWAAYALCAFLLVFTRITLGWLYPQLARLTLGAGHALRNGVLLTLIEGWRNLLLLVIQLVSAALILVLWPFSAVLLLSVIPVLPALLSAVLVTPVLEARLIK